MAEYIFVDTNPIVYFLDRVQPYYERVSTYLAQKSQEDAEFYTSTVTDAEFLVKPMSENQPEKITLYRDFLDEFGFLKCFVTNQIAEIAARIRAKYDGIKLGDALQLAASIDCGCDAFFTNDKRLKQVTEANIVYLGDL